MNAALGFREYHPFILFTTNVSVTFSSPIYQKDANKKNSVIAKRSGLSPREMIIRSGKSCTYKKRINLKRTHPTRRLLLER